MAEQRKDNPEKQKNGFLDVVFTIGAFALLLVGIDIAADHLRS